jgi:hypothetical protein
MDPWLNCLGRAIIHGKALDKEVLGDADSIGYKHLNHFDKLGQKRASLSILESKMSNSVVPVYLSFAVLLSLRASCCLDITMHPA